MVVWLGKAGTGPGNDRGGFGNCTPILPQWVSFLLKFSEIRPNQAGLGLARNAVVGLCRKQGHLKVLVKFPC